MTAQTETKVLALLASGSEDFGIMCFSEIAYFIKLNRSEIRRACRSLKRKGLAEFHRGCWTEDGVPAGSGYGATKLGRDYADQKLVEKFASKRWI